MSDRMKRIPPALKHAAYSTTALLPGEDPAAFEKLHQGLIAELTPNGTLEEELVATISRLVWRKQNLKSLQIGERIKERWRAILAEKLPDSKPRGDIMDFLRMDLSEIVGPEEASDFREELRVAREAFRAAQEQARKEFGPQYGFVEMKGPVTLDQLMKDLEVEEHLDAMISRRLKQLLFLRGLKSMSTIPASAPRPARLPSPKAT